jgi:hypothetical protein
VKALLSFLAIFGTTAHGLAQTATPSPAPATSAPSTAAPSTAAPSTAGGSTSAPSTPDALPPAATSPAATSPESSALDDPTAATATAGPTEPAPLGQTEWTPAPLPPTRSPSAPLVLEGSDSSLLIGGSWDLTQPVGSSTDFANVFSAQGVAFQVRYLGLGRTTFGGLAAWEGWSEKNDRTTVEGNVTVGGVQVHTTWINTVFARAQASMFDIRAASSRRRPVPYAALNFGGAHMVRRVDIGIHALTEESWHWAVAPEVGVEVPITRVTVTAGARFNYLFSSGEGPEQLYFTFALGLASF